MEDLVENIELELSQMPVTSSKGMVYQSKYNFHSTFRCSAMKV